MCISMWRKRELLERTQGMLGQPDDPLGKDGLESLGVWTHIFQVHNCPPLV